MVIPDPDGRGSAADEGGATGGFPWLDLGGGANPGGIIFFCWKCPANDTVGTGLLFLSGAIKDEEEALLGFENSDVIEAEEKEL